MSVDNTRLLEKLNELAQECQALSYRYDNRRITSPAHGLKQMHDTLIFLSSCMKDNTLNIADLPDVAYAFIKATEEISERLTKTFVTPLEREDIDALALALYKIPKTLEKFAERFQISPPKLPKSTFQRQSELLQQAMETLELMVRELRSSPDLAKIKDQNLKLQYLEGEADKLMVERLKDLYNSPHDAISVVALKDLYDLLEKVIDRCRDAGNIIVQIVLKNS